MEESYYWVTQSKNIKKGNFLNRLIFDEILATFLINSKVRKAIKKIKKNKQFNQQSFDIIKEKISYELTKDQLNAIDEINSDLKSNHKCLDFYRVM